MGIRSLLQRFDLGLVRHPYPSRLTTTLRNLGVDGILDVGANIGQFATATRAAGFSGRIVSCEPLSDAFALLERRSARDPRWSVVRTAVGAATTIADINVSENSYSSSVLAMTQAHLEAAPDSRIVRREQVAVTTVADLLREHDLLASSTLLKVDTQGYEEQVLDGVGPALRGVAAIQLELSFVPLYDKQSLFPDLLARLAAEGFTLHDLEPGISDPRTGRLLQCDGLFVGGAHGDLTSGGSPLGVGR